MRIPRRVLGWLALVSALSLGGYLAWSGVVYQVGFPLDDAWIHQTYARNFGQLGEWAFIPGQPSAGSTAPLWSAVLALGHAAGAGPYVWTYVLGWGALLGLAVLGYGALRVFAPERERWALAGGLLLALEWHMVWAAGSGMETLPYAALVVLVLVWLAAGWGRWFWLGGLIGLAAWVRPDAITLLGPAGFALWFAARPVRQRLRAGGLLLIGFALLFAPYLGFNRWLAGQWWPNTFFAKQAEYAVYQAFPLWERYLTQASLPLIGVGAVLLPGVLLLMWEAWKQRRWAVLGGGIWWLGYVGIYALRLPVTYQHGRYLMPAMPIFFLWGLAGLANWVRPRTKQAWRRVLGQAWVLVAGVVLALFWVLGARAYALDVAFIESEMVITAHWVRENTPPEALVAAHDIGALGYFGERQLLDLAGLVTPEVIPFLQDESRLRHYLDTQGADYFVTLEGWYPLLESHASHTFTTQSVFSPAQGGTNMVVYQWPVR